MDETVAYMFIRIYWVFIGAHVIKNFFLERSIKKSQRA